MVPRGFDQADQADHNTEHGDGTDLPGQNLLVPYESHMSFSLVLHLLCVCDSRVCWVSPLYTHVARGESKEHATSHRVAEVEGDGEKAEALFLWRLH